MSERGYYAHRGAGRDTLGFVWSLGLTSHTTHRGVMLRLLTVPGDVIAAEDLPERERQSRLYTDEYRRAIDV